ncbi:MAG: hypothetical protein R3B72_09200 [Polyangiaceae bacterium]
MEFLTVVEVVADDGSWGHAPRGEIIGVVGAIVGTVTQAGTTKDYVSLPELGKVYGIARHNLRSRGTTSSLAEHLPYFAQHYFDIATYAFTARTRLSHGEIADALRDAESGYPDAALLAFPAYARVNLATLRENGLPLLVSDDELHRFLETYGAALERRLHHGT